MKRDNGSFQSFNDYYTQMGKTVRRGGNIRKKPLNRPFKKIAPEKLTAYMEAHPDAYLRETAAEFSCCQTAVRKALRRLNITRKKDKTLPGAGPAESKRIQRKNKRYPKGKNCLY